MSSLTPPIVTTAQLFANTISVNTAPPTELRTALTAALGVARRVDEVDEARAHHPRIGEKPQGEGASHAFARAGQASVDADDATVNAAIAGGNREYEERFGRVFLIRAAGRSGAEIPVELNRRLQLDDSAEQRIAGVQLLEIARIRRTQLFAREPA